MDRNVIPIFILIKIWKDVAILAFNKYNVGKFLTTLKRPILVQNNACADGSRVLQSG